MKVREDSVPEGHATIAQRFNLKRWAIIKYPSGIKNEILVALDWNSAMRKIRKSALREALPVHDAYKVPKGYSSPGVKR
jgi:hypothetical protein